MKILIFIIFLNSAQHSYGQTSLLTKQSLSKIFKASIKQAFKRRVQRHSNPWMICNEDNSYYKSDTLKLSLSSENYPDCKCLCFIDWTFYKKDAFVLTEEFLDEPPRVSATKISDWFKIKLLKKNQDLILETYNQDSLIEKFKVVSITPIITLIRIKKDH